MRVEVDETATAPNQRFAALAVCLVMLSAAALAAVYGRAPGPDYSPLLSIAATVWSLADLLTAFLFLAQFYVSGRLFFGVLAGAYAFIGLLTWGYIATYPHVISTAPSTPGQDQLPFVFWLIWHCAFPILVACAALIDSPTKRVLSRRAISILTGVIAVAPALAAAAVFAIVVTNRDSLPHLVVGSSFQHVNSLPIHQTVVVLNGLVTIFLFTRSRPLTPLMLWLAVTTFSVALDAIMMGYSTARFSYAFDTGKLITVFTACIVLVMLLSDIVGLYERLGRVARIDVLTSLNNRRSFDEYFEVIYPSASRYRRSIGMLVIDIDLFKRYNDSYGHLAGDACLRQVARTVAQCARQPLDFVARYGGEEFVVVLPDTPARGVAVVAERIRAAVEGLGMNHESAARGLVTVSVGVAYVAHPRPGDKSSLFEAADAALYKAKDRGGNAVSLDGIEETSAA